MSFFYVPGRRKIINSQRENQSWVGLGVSLEDGRFFGCLSCCKKYTKDHLVRTPLTAHKSYANYRLFAQMTQIQQNPPAPATTAITIRHEMCNLITEIDNTSSRSSIINQQTTLVNRGIFIICRDDSGGGE